MAELNFPDPTVEQEYSSDDVPDVVWKWDGDKWTSKAEGGGSSGNMSLIPPYVGKSGPATNLSNDDGKVMFSLDNASFAASLSVPAETLYYCDWTSDIRSAAQGSQYETSILETFPEIGVSETIELSLKIDKLPDPFSFNPEVGVTSETEYTSNTISPLETINAPTSVWGSSNAPNSYIAIGAGGWVAIPSAVNSLYVNMNERIRIKHKTGTAPDTAYVTTLNIGYGTGAGEFETSSFSTTTLDSVVNQPTITAPAYGETVESPSLEFLSNAFVAQNAGTHASSFWQAASDAEFLNIIKSDNSSTSLTSWKPFESDPYDGVIYVRVKYIGTLNNIESAWSNTVQIFATDPPQYWYYYLSSSDGFQDTAGPEKAFDDNLSTYVSNSQGYNTDFELRFPKSYYISEFSLYTPFNVGGVGFNCYVNGSYVGNIATQREAWITFTFLNGYTLGTSSVLRMVGSPTNFPAVFSAVRINNDIQVGKWNDQ